MPDFAKPSGQIQAEVHSSKARFPRQAYSPGYSGEATLLPYHAEEHQKQRE